MKRRRNRHPPGVEDLVTFVIPTIGRNTLNATIDSLIGQRDAGWRALVVTDGRRALSGFVFGVADVIRAAPTNSAGLTRNAGLPWVETPWTAFVDDDDTVDSEYVAQLRRLQHETDVVVFRMEHPDLGVLPPWDQPRLRWGQVGISYAVRTHWLTDLGVCFIRETDVNDRNGGARNEDIALLNTLRALGARVRIADCIGYYARPHEPARSG